MSNTNTTASANTAYASAVTEEQLRSLLRESQEADASARDARLWASPTYVAAKEAAAELAWVAYRKASEALLGSYWGVEYK